MKKRDAENYVNVSKKKVATGRKKTQKKKSQNRNAMQENGRKVGELMRKSDNHTVPLPPERKKDTIHQGHTTMNYTIHQSNAHSIHS